MRPRFCWLDKGLFRLFRHGFAIEKQTRPRFAGPVV